MNKLIEIKMLVDELNKASDAYYNGKEILMNDAEFDSKLKRLSDLEKEINVVMSNSPTVNVGAPVLNKLEKVKHEYKDMLSLEKVHSAEEIIKFAKGHELIAMIKLDGLSVRLVYEDGKLVKAVTRGNGSEGSLITNHVKQFKNVPLSIDKKGTYVVDGEAIIDDKDFKLINDSLPKGVEKFKNSRNLASGTLSLLDTSLVKERYLQFVLWDVIVGEDSNGFYERIENARQLGFTVVPAYTTELNTDNVNDCINFVFGMSKECFYPNDGVVFKINDIKYGEKLGQTSHHFCNAVAYKAAAEYYPTKLIDVEWTMGKTGSLCPTIITEPVEIEGTIVTRASVHNCTIFKEFGFSKGCTCWLFKANQIIPQCHSVEDDTEELFEIPNKCPVCGAPTEIRKDGVAEVLYCTSRTCQGKMLGKLNAFVSKQGMNIDGLSEQTLSLLLDRGYINSYKDIYHLKNYKAELSSLPKQGAKSIAKLIQSIENSRQTTLDRFLTSLSIPNVGRSTSKDISAYCKGDIDNFIFIISNTILEFMTIDGIGTTVIESLDSWWEENAEMVFELLEEVEIIVPEEKTETTTSTDLSGATFCITGKLTHFANRDALVESITTHNGKYLSGVSSKLNYLINNDKTSTSGKNKKALEVGCKIISESDYLAMIGEN